MKWSNFNFLFVSSANESLLYNSRMNSFLQISESLYNVLKLIEKGDSLSLLPDNIIEYLRERKVLVDLNEDDSYIMQSKYLKCKRAFLNTSLGLVLAPTLACNFKCPYCYENNLPAITITEEVQDHLIDFINRHTTKVDGMALCWHGGEPLIAFKAIKSIIDKIEKKSEIPLLRHEMVSNGFLFNHEMCDFFRDSHLNYVQITIDGMREVHNRNRIHKLGIPTYDVITDNIDMILSEMPDCKVGVRVNIHNGNKEDYPNIHNELTNRWKGKNCVVRPALVIGQSTGCNVSCLSPHEKSDFYINLYKKYGIKNIEFEPEQRVGSCSASYENSYIIDPEGLLYKCWTDIGLKDRVIGNLKDGVQNWQFISEYLLNSDKFVDSKCLKCKMFPICRGGCNRFRVENKYHNVPYDICPTDEEGFAKYLEIMYENSKIENMGL